jgi:hypothetical protein
MKEHEQPISANLPALIDGEPIRNWPKGGPEIDIRHVRTDALKLPRRQLRKHSKRQLAQIEASMRRFGNVSPIKVDADYRIVSGVGRWLAAKAIGSATVPVVILDHLTRTELRLLAIADNQLASLSDWDKELLSIEFGELSLDIDSDLEITGFDTVEIDDLILGGASGDVVETIELPDPDQFAIAKLGDMFVMGDHRLHCADARDPRSYERLLGMERARMAFADAPFNVPISGNVSGKGLVKHREFVMGSGEMSGPEYTSFLTTIFRQMAAFSLDGSIHFQCIDWRHCGQMQVAGEAAYTELKNLIVWKKDNAGMGSFYRSHHELIQVWKVGIAPHVNNFGLGTKGRYRTNIWEYPGANTVRRGRLDDLAVHPTVKPTVMVADAIRDVSRRGDIVLDPFCGSGTTILACERTQRRARCLELDPLYVDAAVLRWQVATGREAIHEQTGQTFVALRHQRAGNAR